MRERFVKTTYVEAPVETVFAFHQRPDALTRLTPPWDPVRVVQPPQSLAVGTRVILEGRLGPFPVTIEAVHVEYDPPHGFTDEMVRGPFRHWRHRHRFESAGTGTHLIDDVTYELPLGRLGNLFGGPIARDRLERLFAFRHDVTKRACEAR